MGIGHLFALAIHASVFDLLLGHHEIVALSTDPDPEQHLDWYPSRPTLDPVTVWQCEGMGWVLWCDEDLGVQDG